MFVNGVKRPDKIIIQKEYHGAYDHIGLALFTLIILSTFVYFIARRLKAPYTVLLVLVGLLLVPVANAPYVGSVLGFIDDMVLTPELLFFIFLPILIFESGFNMSLRKMLDSAWTISFMAIGVMSLSVLMVDAGLFYLPLIGIQIPLWRCCSGCLFQTIRSPRCPCSKNWVPQTGADFRWRVCSMTGRQWPCSW